MSVDVEQWRKHIATFNEQREKTNTITPLVLAVRSVEELLDEIEELRAQVAEMEALNTYIAALNTLQERWTLSSTEHQADDSDRFAVLIDDAGGIVGYGTTPSAAMKAALDKYYEQDSHA